MKNISLLLVFFLCANFLTFSQNITELNGSLIQPNGEFLEGNFESFYDDGMVQEIFQIENGKQHGEFISFYPNGQKMEKGNYTHGLKFGKWTKWSETGNILSETFYNIEGRKHGTWKVWDDNNNLKALMVYNSGNREGSGKFGMTMVILLRKLVINFR